jgi:hypothetical protein
MTDFTKNPNLGNLLPRKYRSMGDGSFAERVVSSGLFPHSTAQLVKPASATQYTAGDHIANNATGASVTPMEFTVGDAGCSGILTGARCTITAASGTIVLPSFDLLLFRPAASIPFEAAGYPADNAVMNITAAAMKELVGVLSFVDSGWRNQLGAATAAGDHIYQAVTFATRPHAPFNLASLSETKLIGVLQDRGAWNPGNVQNTFDFLLDIAGV